MSEKINEREIALLVLEEIIFSKAYINIVLDKALKNDNLKDESRRFIKSLVTGVIQNYLALDYDVKKLNIKKLKNKAYLILLISIYQFRFMSKVPNFAILNEAKILANKYLDNYASKFIYATLKNYFENYEEIKESDFKNEEEYLSIKYSIPEFVIKLWNKQYGKDECLKFLDSLNTKANLTFRVNQNKNYNYPQNFKKGVLAPTALIYEGNSRQDYLNLVNEGYLSIQDESGQLVAPLLELKNGDKVLDMCAAPGSKTAHMGEILNNQGEIVALDLYPHRVKLIENALKRLNIQNVKLMAKDASNLKNEWNANSFNKILLDAPCSGLGVIKRKPDIKMNVSPSSIDEIVSLQKVLLDNAYYLLAKGGLLVYSTCTLNKKENEKQVEEFLKKYEDMELVKERTIYPYLANNDGFFYAAMRKKGE